MSFWILRASRATSLENDPCCQPFQESQISPAMQLRMLSSKLFCTFGAKRQCNKLLQWTALILYQIASESTTREFSGVENLPFGISLSSCLSAYILLDTAIPVWVQGRLGADILQQTNKSLCLLNTITFFQWGEKSQMSVCRQVKVHQMLELFTNRKSEAWSESDFRQIWY